LTRNGIETKQKSTDSVARAGTQEMQPHPFAKVFGQNWLDLSKFGWI